MDTLISLVGEGEHLTPLQMSVRAFSMFVIMLVLVRIAGMRTFAKKSSFDNIIVIMLGAILATVITLAVTASLFTGKSKLYDPQVSNGKILVGIERPDAAALPQIERALLTAGVADLKRG